MTIVEFAQRYNFNIVPSSKRAEHLPARVLAHLPDHDVVIFTVNDEHSDTAAFCEHYKINVDDCANTIVLRYRKEGLEHHAAAVTLGSRRLDVNGTVKKRLGANRLSFAKREAAVEITGMEFGGITAIGLPSDMPVLIDEMVLTRPFIVVGAGVRRTKLLIASAHLKNLSGANVASLTFDQNGLIGAGTEIETVSGDDISDGVARNVI